MVAEAILGAVGFTIIVTQSYLFKGIRESVKRWRVLSKFLSCPQCVGLWVGVGMYYADIELLNQAGTVSLSAYTWFLLMRYFVIKYD